jgi:hypothetical protein
MIGCDGRAAQALPDCGASLDLWFLTDEVGLTGLVGKTG